MSIKTIGIIFVSFIIFSAIVHILIPSGNMEKSIKLVLSLGFIFVIISTFGSIKFELPEIDYDYSIQVESGNIFDLSMNTSVAMIENQIKNNLIQKNITLEYIEINADISDDKRIIIDSVIYKTNSDEKSIIEKTIYEITGCRNIMEN